MAYRGKQSDPFYHSSAWLAVRKNALLRDHEICQICLRAFQAGLMRKPRRATIVHHLIPRTAPTWSLTCKICNPCVQFVTIRSILKKVGCMALTSRDRHGRKSPRVS